MLAFFSLTLFVSATLLFFVQPMIGKMILPRLGGTPAVWNTCMVFFQAMLLVGYAYTHTLSTYQSRRRQLVIHAILLFVPLALMMLPFSVGDWSPSTEEILTFGESEIHIPGLTVYRLLWLLLGVVGLPFFVVATSAPLLQKWFVHTGHPAAKDPYFLYGASNLGSMIGLLMYPAVFEPTWDVATQALVWTAGYVLLVALILGCAVVVWRSSDTPATAIETAPARQTAAAPAQVPALVSTAVSAAPGRRRGVRLPQAPASPVTTVTVERTVPADPDRVSFGRRLRWVLLAAAPSSLMLGVTTYLTTDIAAVPFFWVVPLALYLLTFILVFARWPVVWTEAPHTVILYLQPMALLFLVLRMVGNLNTIPVWGDFLLHLFAFFTTTLLCHGELARDRPSARHLTEFYLWMSVGGVLGGLFNALIAPIALPYGIVEYPLAMVVACLARPLMVQDISQGRDFAVPRRFADVPVLVFDAVLYLFGMTTYAPPGRKNTRTSWLASAPMEKLLDVCVPVGFGGFALVMLVAGEHEWIKLGPVTLVRKYMMALTVVVLLALGMRPIRFGLALLALFLVVTLHDRADENRVFEDRGFFGLVRVREYDELEKNDRGNYELARRRRTLIHGGINHGQQLTWPPELRREPITYFHPTNGIGEIFHKLTWGNPPGRAGSAEHRAWLKENWWVDAPEVSEDDPTGKQRAAYQAWLEPFTERRAKFYPGDPRLPTALVGLGAVSPWAQLVGTQAQPPYAVVGLGAGTLATHGTPYQRVDFYEIDPIIKRLSVPPSQSADDLIFYYVDDAVNRGTDLSILMGDGRLKMREAPEKYYHAILLDAFSSDAVPVHLLTREAVELYLDKLAEGGVLIFNTTNRYVNLPPVLARIAEDLDLECLWCPDWSDSNFPEKYGADWVALRPRDRRPGGYANGGPSLPDRLQVSRGRWRTVEPLEGRPWTDSYSNLLRVMRW